MPDSWITGGCVQFKQMKTKHRIEVIIDTHETTVIRLSKIQTSIIDSRPSKEVLIPHTPPREPDPSANRITNQKEQNNEDR